MFNNKNKNIKLSFSLFFSLLFLAGCDRDVPLVNDPAEISISTPNQFSLFLNPQYSLSANQYTVVAATNSLGEVGSFTLRIENNNELILNEVGVWTNSGGQDETSANNVSFSLKMKKTGGLKVSLVSADANSYVYLLDANNNILFEDDDSGEGNNALIDLPEMVWNSKQLSDAYYQAIDPLDERLTLNTWKQKNGFNSGSGIELSLIFRDTKDLGYGRKMYFRKNTDDSLAVYVENYQFAGIEGLEYGLLNLDALVNNDQRHHFGTNAIEWSPGPSGGELFAKFYTFKADPRDASVDETRLAAVNLDGRGDKAMPGMCIACHGGSSHALEPDGSFASLGNTGAKLQVLEPDTFDFSTMAGLTRADQENIIKQVNEMILATYPAVQVAGEWQSDFAIELVEGWYGGSGLPNSEYDGDYVPVGWQPNLDTGNPPAGADELFLKVVKPSCMACHTSRGTDLFTNISFSSYNSFISYAETIEEYVYEAGIMPLALLPYNNFWNSTNPSQPELLAAHLPGFSHANSDGSVDRPGKPVAKAGPNRAVNGPVSLNAESSLFYQAVEWSILSAPSLSTSATIDDVTALRPTFSADVDGNYVLQLVVSNDTNDSSTTSVTITHNSSLATTRNLNFVTDIKPIIQGVAAPTTNCISCHTTGTGGTAGIPVLYTDSTNLYHEVLERVNLKYVERSMFLKKPTNFHHYGGLQPGYDINGESDNDTTHYNTVLNWIIEGAREN